jgi:hypothetical protein
MDKKLLDQLKDGDEISVALRGGAGWLNGAIVWRREDVVLLKVSAGEVGMAPPYALVFLGEISALGVPRELEAPTPESRHTGFMRD